MRWAAALFLLVTAGSGAWLYLEWRERPLPPRLSGTLVFVSDRSGIDALYAKRLPRGRERRLTKQLEATREPALSPDGREVAFSMGGRIGLVGLASEEVRILTLGVDWRDSSPAWHPGGKGLLVCSRRAALEKRDLHYLAFEEGGSVPGGVERRPLTLTPGLDESSPVFSRDGASLFFVREEDLFQLDTAAGRTLRLTGGFRRIRHARLLPTGRLVFPWSQDKQYGIDVMDSDGKNRETLWQGSVAYRTLAPSPDGSYFAATFAFDLGFHPAEALKPRQTEEVWLLDVTGRKAGALARSWRYSNHSPDWGR